MNEWKYSYTWKRHELTSFSLPYWQKCHVFDMPRWLMKNRMATFVVFGKPPNYKYCLGSNKFTESRVKVK